VVLKVGVIAPVGIMVRGKRVVRRKNNTKGTKMLNHSH